MRVAWQCVFAVSILLTVSSANAECEIPDNVVVPEDANETEEQMLAVQKVVVQYMDSMEAYLECIELEDQALGEEKTDEQAVANVQKHNEAVDAMETVAAQYNEQVKAFKSRSN